MSLITHLSSMAEHDRLVAAKKEKLVVIDFHATWCGPCHAIAPKFEDLSKHYKGVATFAKVDVDAVPDVAKHYTIRAMPTFVFIKNGTKVDEVKGANAGAIETAIRKYTGVEGGAGSAFPGSGQTLSGDAPPRLTQEGESAGGVDLKTVLGLLVILGLWWYYSQGSGDVDLTGYEA